MTAIKANPPTTSPTPSFEVAAAAVMVELQASLAALLEDVPGNIQRAVDLKAALSVETKPAWQVFRLSRSANLREAANIPSKPMMRRILDSALSRGVPQQTADRVWRAYSSFERLIQDNAGDRDSLIAMMVSARSTQEGDDFAIKARRSAFRANAMIWGVQARLRVWTAIYLPSLEQNVDRLLFVRGEIGLQRAVENRPLKIVAHLDVEAPNTEPSAPAQVESGMPPSLRLMEQYCSHPLPQVKHRSIGKGLEEAELIFQGCGRSAAITLYANMLMPVPREEGPFSGNMVVALPAESVVHDMLVPTGWSNPGSARVAVYGRGDLSHIVFERRAEDLMPQTERFAYLGASDLPPVIEDAPNHVDAVKQSLTRLGAFGTRFDVYRYQVAYPVLHSVIGHSVDSLRS